MKAIIKHDTKPDWFLLYDHDGQTIRAAGSYQHCQGYAMKSEKFPDGSEIVTDETTGNRTIIGEQAHAEYFKRLRSEQITKTTPETAVMAFCVNLDGTRKAELIRRSVTNPLTKDWLGEYGWEVWSDCDPEHVVRYMTEEKARTAFKAAMLHGTNSMGVPA